MNRWLTLLQLQSAIAQGDFTQKIRDVPATGEMLEIFNTVNGLADMLQLFSAEVVRVNHETGTTGQLGAQAEVGHVYGTWQELTYVPPLCSSNSILTRPDGRTGCP